jgi:inorganic triphosphatase YgiF
MAQELELKFEIAPRDAQRLARDPLLAWAPVSQEDQTSVYFDTPKGKLRKAGYTLRLRRSGRKITQTVKASGPDAGLFDRDECECAVRSMRPDFRAAKKTPMGPLLKGRTQAKLRAVAKMRIERTIWPVDDGHSLIEVTTDIGRVEGGECEARVSELELELRRGSELDLFKLAEKLSRHYPLRIGVLSKADRAFALAAGKMARPWKAPRIDLAAGMTVADGFTVIAMSCLKHFRLNEELMVEARDVEALHQMRVAIRRLRSAFDLFAPILEDDDDYERLKKELRTLPVATVASGHGPVLRLT